MGKVQSQALGYPIDKGLYSEFGLGTMLEEQEDCPIGKRIQGCFMIGHVKTTLSCHS